MNIPNVRGYKVYNNADSKDVENYILYTNDGTCFVDNAMNGMYSYHAYLDPEFTKPVNADELLRMFLQGCIICVISEDYPPYFVKAESCGELINIDGTSFMAISVTEHYKGAEPAVYYIVSSEYHSVGK